MRSGVGVDESPPVRTNYDAGARRCLDVAASRVPTAMTKRLVRSVEPRPDGSWAVQRDGTKRADSLHQTKDAAVARGVDLGTRNNGQLRIKGKDGRIQDERTYGTDPFPPAG